MVRLPCVPATPMIDGEEYAMTKKRANESDDQSTDRSANRSTPRSETEQTGKVAESRTKKKSPADDQEELNEMRARHWDETIEDTFPASDPPSSY